MRHNRNARQGTKNISIYPALATSLHDNDARGPHRLYISHLGDKIIYSQSANMEKLARCAVHRKQLEYVCPACDDLLLCETCKRDHETVTGHAPGNCKEAGLAIMRQCIQDAGGRLTKGLVKGLRKWLKELEAGILREIYRFQESCMQTKGLREMRKLDREGRYAELYLLYAKSLPAGGANKNGAKIGELNKRLLEMINIASGGLKRVLSRVAASAVQCKPVFAAYKKDEVLVVRRKNSSKTESCQDEDRAISALNVANMSKFKAVCIYSFCTVGDCTASKLASRLQTHPISALYFSGRYISDAGVEVLARAAFRGKSLSAFCISGDRISDTGAKAVAEAAQNCPSLTTLYLDVGNISDSGAKAVAEAVKSCPLSVFYIGSRKISDSGAKAVAEAVKDAQLSVFCLCGGEMSDAGAISVAKTMKDCPLSAFYLVGNIISNAGATAVAETLSSGECASTLSAFCIQIDDATDSGTKKVADAIRGCTKLSALYIGGKPISGETLVYILESMISTIRSVNLCIGEISKEQMDSCLDRLQHSGVAKQLKLRLQSMAGAYGVCKEFAAEWHAKLSEFRDVYYILGLFEDDVILEVPE